MFKLRSISARLILALSLTVAIACGVLGTFSVLQQRGLTRLALEQQLKQAGALDSSLARQLRDAHLVEQPARPVQVQRVVPLPEPPDDRPRRGDPRTRAAAPRAQRGAHHTRAPAPA